ncbi:hypothetical protein HGRIS_008117 [Hohenbuehelia grisea]|uniref:Uncharacterized protein n=1 Tax=Hohenbuehelia grisea TaxID=104357 RepID=A0ABR3J6Z5_9AGAR
MEGNSTGSVVKKQEDPSDDQKPKQDVKPAVKTLNRVPRACVCCPTSNIFVAFLKLPIECV